jgi:hypothetical protein
MEVEQESSTNQKFHLVVSVHVRQAHCISLRETTGKQAAASDLRRLELTASRAWETRISTASFQSLAPTENPVLNFSYL